MAENVDNLIGKTLGTCTLQRIIGRGGMSTVYLAQQLRPLRQVAVKVIRPNLTMDSRVYNEFLARFQLEADVIAQLEHVNIIPIYEYGEEERSAYLVMPYLSKGNLQDVLTRRGALPLQKTVSYINQAASALGYAHAHGVIHRDLKPANFLLHADGRVVLTDFGIARMVHAGNSPQGLSLTLTGAILGTPNYMAPEMALGKQIDFRTDIYELGIVLFQMLSGDVPFKGSNFFEVAEQHLQSPLPMLHLINPTIPTGVNDVLQKATAKRPEDRYTSAGALAHALRIAATQPDSTSRIFFSQTTDYIPPTKQKGSPPLSTRALLAVQKPKRTKRLWPMFVGILFVIFALGGIFINSLITGHQSASSQGSQASYQQIQAVQSTIREFYDNINKKDYPVAYYLWGTEFQNSTDFCQFLSEYPQNNHYQIVSFSSVTPRSNGTFNVVVTIQTGSGESYPRTYLVGSKNGTWKILQGSSNENGVCTLTTPTTRTPTSTNSISTTTQQAVNVMNQYYDDINNRIYGSAYYLREYNFQHPCLDACLNSYRSFVDGYANTEHDYITVNNTVLNTDGTVEITITITATQATSTGIQKKIYPDRTYHVGQLQNGLWEILNE